MSNNSDEIFADTCVLLNFVQQEWEHDTSTALIESDAVVVVFSQNVLDELVNVADRRQDIYRDLIDFLIETGAEVEEYDLAERHVYFQGNDVTHVQRVQGELASHEDRARVLKRLRRFTREAEKRVDYLESLLADGMVDPLVPLGLRFDIDRIIDHDADTKVLTDAAAWTANGGSGVLVTLDNEDLIDKEERLVEAIIEDQGPEWEVEIVTPSHLISELSI